MLRGDPPYPRLPIARDKVHAAELADMTDEKLIPGFGLGVALGGLPLSKLFEETGWEPKYPGSLPSRYIAEYWPVSLKCAARLLIKGPSSRPSFHRDPKNLSHPIRWHKTSQPYVALFATPTEQLLSGEISANALEQQGQLWQGEQDFDIWRSVYIHHGKANSPIVFRSSGDTPVYHDFQPVRPANRRVAFISLTFHPVTQAQAAA